MKTNKINVVLSLNKVRVAKYNSFYVGNGGGGNKASGEKCPKGYNVTWDQGEQPHPKFCKWDSGTMCDEYGGDKL